MPERESSRTAVAEDGRRLHEVVVVGGGAGGLELVTRLGNRLGRSGRARVTLIEKTRTHFWKPHLHEIAAGSMDLASYETNYLAQSHWHGFRYRIGEMTGLDRARRLVHVAPFVDEDGDPITGCFPQLRPARNSRNGVPMLGAEPSNEDGEYHVARFSDPCDGNGHLPRSLFGPACRSAMP